MDRCDAMVFYTLSDSHAAAAALCGRLVLKTPFAPSVVNVKLIEGLMYSVQSSQPAGRALFCTLCLGTYERDWVELICKMLPSVVENFTAVRSQRNRRQQRELLEVVQAES